MPVKTGTSSVVAKIGEEDLKRLVENYSGSIMERIEEDLKDPSIRSYLPVDNAPATARARWKILTQETVMGLCRENLEKMGVEILPGKCDEGLRRPEILRRLGISVLLGYERALELAEWGTLPFIALNPEKAVSFSVLDGRSNLYTCILPVRKNGPIGTMLTTHDFANDSTLSPEEVLDALRAFGIKGALTPAVANRDGKPAVTVVDAASMPRVVHMVNRPYEEARAERKETRLENRLYREPDMDDPASRFLPPGRLTPEAVRGAGIRYPEAPDEGSGIER
jgi:hypothetical protein